MERIDGFVNLDILLQKKSEELIKQGIVKEVSIGPTIGLKRSMFIIKFNNSQYFFKECSYLEAVTELIANEILDNLGMKNVKYDLAYINGHYGVISKDFKKQGKKYIDGNDVLEEYIRNLSEEIALEENNDFKQILEEEYNKFGNKNNFELIWHSIESHYKNFDNKDEIVSRIMVQLGIMHIVDILILNGDRNKSNWVIEEDMTEVNLVPMFDHALAFEDIGMMALRVEPLNEEEIYTDIYNELKQFIKRSDSTYYNLFIELKDKISIETLKTAFNTIEGKIGVDIDEDIKNKILNNYKNHLEKLDDVLKTYKTTEKDGR